MSKHKTLKHQIITELMNQRRYGQSKYNARREEKTSNPEGIFSKQTYESYESLCKTFGKWVANKYQCRDLAEARYYVSEYLQMKISEGKSAWTIKTIAAALAKLYHVTSKDFGVIMPARERKNIKRSRNEPNTAIERKHMDIVNFVKGSGLRRSEAAMLNKEDVYESAGRVIVHVRNGKGGKERMVTVLSEYTETIRGIVDKTLPNTLVFPHIPLRIPMHHYRGCFAKAMYERIARPIVEIPKEERYIMRKDRAGEIFDKRAMLAVSQQLGHNRISVIARSYLY